MNIIIKRRSQFVRVLSSPLLAHRTLIDTSHSPFSNVRTAHKFEESKLISYLKSKDVFQKEVTSIDFKQFTHGQSNPTFILEVDGADKERIVVRKQPPGKLLKGAHAVDREYRVLTALSSSSGNGSNVPVPKTLLNCLDSEIIGTPFFCYKFVEGRFYKSPQLPSVDPARKHAMYKGMLDTLAKIHSVDVDQCGLGDYGLRMGTTPGDDQTPPVTPYVQRQVKTWSRQYKSTETEIIEDMEDLMKNLPRLLPPNAEDHSCLVHGDYRMDNLIFNKDEDTVAAVLDWELSTLGDRLSDLAYNSIVYHLDPSGPIVAGLKGLDLEKEGIPSQHEAIRYYGERLEFHSKGRLSAPSAKELDYYLAFSFFRVCAILQGVYKRSQQGNASADNANAALQFAKETAKLGNDLLKKYEHEANIGELSLEGVHLKNGGFKSSKPVQQSSQMSDLLVKHEINIIPKSNLFQHLISPKANNLIEKTSHFIIDRIMPAETIILNHMYESPNKWEIHPMMEELKAEAKKEELWNLFMPIDTGLLINRDPKVGQVLNYGAGLTNLEYALIAEMTGRSLLAPEVFNCSAPDTGNMEVLARYGSHNQQEKWLIPLLNGEIRSCFAMTEPEVASSDATNMQATIQRDGDDVILNGRKWWTSGAMDPRCKIAIFMGRTAGDLSNVSKHTRHSMVLVPMNTEGLQIIRPLRVMGFDDAPHGHAEVLFENVRVHSSNIILGEGRGFEIAQGRLGPGRIHHCMRLIGMAERALDLMIERVTQREAFGKFLAEQGTIQQDIALSRVEINQARLLCLNAAVAMDVEGNKKAKSNIAEIKIIAPRMAKTVIDRAMQSYGGMGLSQDTPLAHLWANARVLQLADGPDEVHIASLAKQELRLKAPTYKNKNKNQN